MPSTHFIRHIKEQGSRMFGATLDGDRLGNEMRANRKNFIRLPYDTIQSEICGTVLLYQYYVETTNSIQQIITLGEYHKTQVQQGTFTRILEDLVKKTLCPIDVLLEESFHAYQEKTLFRRGDKPFGHGSLLSQFLKNNPGAITSRQQQYTQYIQRYMGRVKFWGIDMRMMHWFPLLTMDDLFDNQTRNEVLGLVFDIKKYRSDPQGYDRTVCNKLRQVLPPGLYETIRKTKAIHGHMDMMKRLDPYDTIMAVNLCRFARHDTGRGIGGVLDLYQYLRLAKLVRQDKNRIIVCLSGFHHTDALFWFMRLDPSILPIDGRFTRHDCCRILFKVVPMDQFQARKRQFMSLQDVLQLKKINPSKLNKLIDKMTLPYLSYYLQRLYHHYKSIRFPTSSNMRKHTTSSTPSIRRIHDHQQDRLDLYPDKFVFTPHHGEPSSRQTALQGGLKDFLKDVVMHAEIDT